MPPKLIFFLTALLTPIVLLGFALRLLLTPVFPTMEYNLPWFPPDTYICSYTPLAIYSSIQRTFKSQCKNST